MMQGLLWRHHVKAACLREQKSAITSNALSSISQNDKILVYERKIHELEGKVAQENLEKKLIREDKEKLVSLMNELKTKYNELFDNEIEVRKELLLCEQEKLALSKAFVEFEIEKNNRVKELDRDKFEMETKLIQAEQMVIEIQQDDSKKATQIQDLCAKMNEVIHEKKLLSEELAIIQKHTKQLEQDLQKEAKKNQQLSLELLVAVSQKQKSQSDLEDFEKRNRQLTKQLEEIVATSNQMKVENAELKEKQAAFESQLESMRRELVMKELQAEKAQFSSRKSQIDQETESGKLLREHEDKVNKLTSQLEAALAVAANEKKSLELQVERLSLDVNQLAKEKEDLVSAWMAKMQENEELLVAIERLIHENESEVEAYRFKLSTYTSMSNKDEAIVLKELINSYQVREKQLRNELAQFRSRNYRLGNRLRMRHARGSVTLTQLKDNQDGGQDVDPGNEKGDDEMVGFKKLQQQMAQAEGLLVLEREKYASAALVAAELENKNRSLILECQELKTKLQQSQSEGKQYVQSIQDMHETLVKQLEEVRRITLQQKDSMKQQQSVESAAKRMILASPQKAQPGTAASAVDIQALIEEKKQLEGKLAANTKQWTALVEHVERRCADLLTKNVMLKQENSDLKGNLKNVMARYQGMTNNK
uniref:DUF4472 domain-containing protein n=1 Tax=Globisporangium ultimum (strain ATCC 200006 / CBS 805.95 / DAOM BR144) TaxID=431595 RepID=K3WC44_GLOUD